MKKFVFAILIAGFLNVSFGMSNRGSAAKPAEKSYVVSANEMQFILTDSINKVMDNPEVGNISVLDFTTFPPKKTDIQNVPCSVTGPPTCVAITPNNKLALVVASMKIDPADKSKQVPDSRVSVVDLDAMEVVKTLVVGNKPSGISVTPDGKRALVCNRNDGTVTVLGISDNGVNVLRTVKISEPGDSLSHIAISPNGKYALATLNLDHSVIKITLKNDSFEVVQKMKVGTGPYCVDFTPDGETAIVANVNGANVNVLDLTGEKIQVADTIFTDVLPEGLDISPDGKWAVVSCMGHTLSRPNDSMRQEYGQLVLLKRKGQRYSIVQRLQIDRIPQAAVFTADSKYVVTSSFESRRLRIFEMDDGKLTDTEIKIDVPGQPCTLRIAN